MIAGTPLTTGFASLHPWLRPSIPLGLKNTPNPHPADRAHGQNAILRAEQRQPGHRPIEDMIHQPAGSRSWGSGHSINLRTRLRQANTRRVAASDLRSQFHVLERLTAETLTRGALRDPGLRCGTASRFGRPTETRKRMPDGRSTVTPPTCPGVALAKQDHPRLCTPHLCVRNELTRSRRDADRTRGRIASCPHPRHPSHPWSIMGNRHSASGAAIEPGTGNETGIAPKSLREEDACELKH